MQKKILFLIFSLLLMMLFGCQVGDDDMLQLTSTLQIPIATETETVKVTQTITQTDLPTVTLTRTPTPLPSATPTRSLDVQQTQWSEQCSKEHETLLSCERDEFMSNIIEDESCNFPCFLGVTPGDDIDLIIDSFSNMYPECYLRMFDRMELGIHFSNISVPLYGIPYVSEVPLDFDSSFGSIRLNLYSENSKTDILFVDIRDTSHSISHEPVLTKLTRLDLYNIIREYGQPDQVLFNLSYYTGIGYSVFLYYEDYSSIIVIGGVDSLSDPMRICPIIEGNWNGKITQIRVFSSTPNYYSSLEELMVEFPYSSERVKPITDLGYSIEEFTEIMLSPSPADRCLYIEQSQWEE